MRCKTACTVVTILAMFATLASAQQNDSRNSNGPYLGQEPPGPTPRLFAPEFFNAEHGYHCPPVFAPNMTEVIWSPQKREQYMVHSRIVDGKWSTPVATDFGLEGGAGDATFSPNGNRIYFCSFQLPDSGAPEKERIWFVEREGDGWSAPQLIDNAVLAHPTHWTFSFADNGNLYFTSEITGARGGRVFTWPVSMAKSTSIPQISVRP